MVVIPKMLHVKYASEHWQPWELWIDGTMPAFRARVLVPKGYERSEIIANVVAAGPDLSGSVEAKPLRIQLEGTCLPVLGTVRFDEKIRTCPVCGKPGEDFTTAVDLICYDGGQAELRSAFDPDGEPEEQGVRVFCPNCTYNLPISEDYADQLVQEALRQ